MTALFKSRDDAPTPPADVNRLSEENQRLHRAVEELSILNDIALAINSTMEPEAINQLIVGKCVRAWAHSREASTCSAKPTPIRPRHWCGCSTGRRRHVDAPADSTDRLDVQKPQAAIGERPRHRRAIRRCRYA